MREAPTRMTRFTSSRKGFLLVVPLALHPGRNCILPVDRGHPRLLSLDAKGNCEELFRASSDSALACHARRTGQRSERFLNRWPHRPWQLAAGVNLGVMVIKPQLAIAMAVCAVARRSSLQRRDPSISNSARPAESERRRQFVL